MKYKKTRQESIGGDIIINLDPKLIQNTLNCSPKQTNLTCNKLKKNYYQWLRMRYHFPIIIISIIGFCWHLNESLAEYWAYKTKVSFTAEEPHDYKYEYPGVTICYKDLAPFWKLKERYPEFGEEVDKIKNEMKLRNDSNFFISSESMNLTSAKRKGNQLQDFYERKLMNESTILDILENWSFGEPDKCHLDSLPIVRDRERIKNCTQISSVLTSINAEFRCFTYFSQFYKANKSDNLFTTTIFKSSNDYENRENRIAYIAFDKNDSNPFETQLRARIAIHPSNMIPDPTNYPNKILYEWWRFYPITYWKTVSYLLEPPYETNCRFYNIRDQNNLQSHYDCVAKCIIKMYRNKCKCLPRSGLLYHKNLLTSNDMFCPFNNECKSLNIRSSCTKSCKPDCISEQYEFETWADIPWHKFTNTTGVTIRRKPVLDQVYRHSPEITWIQLVSDFGGLGGMWLGISVITISKAIICWFNRSVSNNKITERIKN